MMASERGFDLHRPVNDWLPESKYLLLPFLPAPEAAIPNYIVGNYTSFQGYPVFLNVSVFFNKSSSNTTRLWPRGICSLTTRDWTVQEPGDALPI